MAWQFSEAADEIIGGGWGGLVATISCWWYLDSDPNNFQNPILVYSGSGGSGSVRAGIGTTSDGTTMTAFDAAFLTQSAGAPGTGVWYHTTLVMANTQWMVYHGTNPAALTAVGPNTRTAVNSPGSIVLSLNAEWLRGRMANLKIWTRELTESEAEAEAGTYGVVNATSLRRHHTMLSTSMNPDAGADTTALSAGSTAITLVDGPTAITMPAVVAGSAPRATSALTAIEIRQAALAGSAPQAVSALTAVERRLAVVAGSAPQAVSTLIGGTVRPAVLAGAAPQAVGALTADHTRLAALAGSAPPAVGTLAGVFPLNLALPLKAGAPNKPPVRHAGTPS